MRIIWNVEVNISNVPEPIINSNVSLSAFTLQCDETDIDERNEQLFAKLLAEERYPIVDHSDHYLQMILVNTYNRFVQIRLSSAI